MTPLLIMQILEGLLGAAPQLLALFQRASSGAPVSTTDVQQILGQYGIDHAALLAAIAAADAAAAKPAAGKPK